MEVILVVVVAYIHTRIRLSLRDQAGKGYLKESVRDAVFPGCSLSDCVCRKWKISCLISYRCFRPSARSMRISHLTTLWRPFGSSSSSLIRAERVVWCRFLWRCNSLSFRCADRVLIREIMNSPILDELLVLKEDNLTEAEQRRNWFSLPSVIDVYSMSIVLLITRPHFVLICSR